MATWRSRSSPVDPTASGWHRPTLVALDLAGRSARTLYEPTWQLEGLALSPDARRAVVVEGYSSDPDLLSGSAKIVELASGEVSDPWPALETVGVAAWCDDESLWYASCERVGTSCGRIWLDGRREEAWSGDAFIGPDVTKPSCAIAAGGEVVLTTHQAHGIAPELARFDAGTGDWARLSGFNDDLTRDTVFPDVRTLTWTAPDGLEIDGLLMTPGRRRRDRCRYSCWSTAARPGAGTRTSRSRSRTRSCSPTRGTRCSCRTRAAASAAATRSRRP